MVSDLSSRCLSKLYLWLVPVILWAFPQFLAQAILGSSCALPDLTLKSAIPPRSPSSFWWRMTFSGKIWALGLSVAIGVSVLQVLYISIYFYICLHLKQHDFTLIFEFPFQHKFYASFLSFHCGSLDQQWKIFSSHDPKYIYLFDETLHVTSLLLQLSAPPPALSLETASFPHPHVPFPQLELWNPVHKRVSPTPAGTLTPSPREGVPPPQLGLWHPVHVRVSPPPAQVLHLTLPSVGTPHTQPSFVILGEFRFPRPVLVQTLLFSASPEGWALSYSGGKEKDKKRRGRGWARKRKTANTFWTDFICRRGRDSCQLLCVIPFVLYWSWHLFF